MLNTINNDFLKNLSMLDRISSNKGTGAKLMLRDKLKGLAADTQTRDCLYNRTIATLITRASVAQWLEQWVGAPKVVGLIPA